MTQLIARAPIENLLGHDYRPGDTFEAQDEVAAELVARGVAEVVAELPFAS